jgi:hypothetical protein
MLRRHTGAPLAAARFPENRHSFLGNNGSTRFRGSSEMIHHKLDFWLRNPDHLADELLTE